MKKLSSVQNKSKKDVFLASTYGGTGIVVTSDSGQSSTCYIQGIKTATSSEKTQISKNRPTQ